MEIGPTASKPTERVVTHASQVQRIAGCLPCQADRRLGASAFSFGCVKKSQLFYCALMTLWTGVAQWDACRLTFLFPLRRAAVSLKGRSARPCETSNGICFWKRSLIPMGGGGEPAWRIGADTAEQDRRIFSRGCLRSSSREPRRDPKQNCAA